MLALASTVILGSEPHGTNDHILLSDGSGSLPYSDKQLTARFLHNFIYEFSSRTSQQTRYVSTTESTG
jgi:hypothetical protein